MRTMRGRLQIPWRWYAASRLMTSHTAGVSRTNRLNCKSKSCKCQSWCIRRTKCKAKEKKSINCETSIRTRKVEHYFHKKLEISGY